MKPIRNKDNRNNKKGTRQKVELGLNKKRNKVHSSGMLIASLQVLVSIALWRYSGADLGGAGWARDPTAIDPMEIKRRRGKNRDAEGKKRDRKEEERMSPNMSLRYSTP